MVAGDAWERHRRGEEDARKFGFGRWKGTTFVRASVLRDLAALNKRELLAWDYPWGEHKPQGEKLLYLDHIAELTLADNSRFEELRAACEDAPRYTSRWSASITTWTSPRLPPLPPWEQRSDLP